MADMGSVIFNHIDFLSKTTRAGQLGFTVTVANLVIIVKVMGKDRSLDLYSATLLEMYICLMYSKIMFTALFKM